MIYTGEEALHTDELFDVMFGLEHVVAEFFGTLFLQ
jgi:hypothetical protein